MEHHYHKLHMKCHPFQVDLNRKLRLVRVLDQRLESVQEELQHLQSEYLEKFRIKIQENSSHLDENLEKMKAKIEKLMKIQVELSHEKMEISSRLQEQSELMQNFVQLAELELNPEQDDNLLEVLEEKQMELEKEKALQEQGMMLANMKTRKKERKDYKNIFSNNKKFGNFNNKDYVLDQHKNSQNASQNSGQNKKNASKVQGKGKKKEKIVKKEEEILEKIENLDYENTKNFSQNNKVQNNTFCDYFNNFGSENYQIIDNHGQLEKILIHNESKTEPIEPGMKRMQDFFNSSEITEETFYSSQDLASNTHNTINNNNNNRNSINMNNLHINLNFNDINIENSPRNFMKGMNEEEEDVSEGIQIYEGEKQLIQEEFEQEQQQQILEDELKVKIMELTMQKQRLMDNFQDQEEEQQF